MKKYIGVCISIILLLTISSCTRTEVEDPGLVGGPVGYHYIVHGSADPSAVFVDGNIHTSKITVTVTDYKGNPIAGAYIYFELRLPEDPFNTLGQDIIWWGYLENGYTTMRKKTDGNGVATITYYGPDLISFNTLGTGILVKATMAEDQQSHLYAMPYDFIDIIFIRQGDE